jgi:hypothetical protein
MMKFIKENVFVILVIENDNSNGVVFGSTKQML